MKNDFHSLVVVVLKQEGRARRLHGLNILLLLLYAFHFRCERIRVFIIKFKRKREKNNCYYMRRITSLSFN